MIVERVRPELAITTVPKPRPAYLADPGAAAGEIGRPRWILRRLRPGRRRAHDYAQQLRDRLLALASCADDQLMAERDLHQDPAWSDRRLSTPTAPDSPVGSSPIELKDPTGPRRG